MRRFFLVEIMDYIDKCIDLDFFMMVRRIVFAIVHQLLVKDKML